MKDSEGNSADLISLLKFEAPNIYTATEAAWFTDLCGEAPRGTIQGKSFPSSPLYFDWV